MPSMNDSSLWTRFANSAKLAFQRKGARRRPMSQVIRLAERGLHNCHLFFTRAELNQLLSLYSRRVAAGEWRDYAIDHKPGVAKFCIFRHCHDYPLYAVVKFMSRERTISYRVSSGGRKMREGKDLAGVLAVIERQLRVVS
jgi:hypothetical protein